MELDKIKIKGETYVLVPNKLYRDMIESLEDRADIEAIQNNSKNPTSTIPGEIFHKIILDGENPIKVYREYRNLTITKLAEHVGVTESYISQLENGKRNGTAKMLRSIAKVLGVSVDDLI